MNSSFDNAKLFEQNKDLLKSFTKEELNSLLTEFKFTITKQDRLWNVFYCPIPGTDNSHSITGADLAYLLRKMMNYKKDQDIYAGFKTNGR